MFFEGRELKGYAEPVEPKDLKLGSTYFFIIFLEKELITPIIETRVFIGRNLENEKGMIYFQEIRSYQDGIRYESASKEEKSHFFSSPEHLTNNVFEFERVLDQLMECSLRRRGIKGI